MSDKKKNKRRLIQLVLFILTFITTTHAGGEWSYGNSLWLDPQAYSWSDFFSGLAYSIPFLGILTVHEFGHYFTARWHKVKTTLPYYIPFPPIPFSIGTMGAVIRIKERVRTTIEHFDIGIAGPLAGFVLAIGVIWYGFATLPPKDYVYEIHPEYVEYGDEYGNVDYDQLPGYDSIPNLKLGQNLTFMFFEHYVADPERVPDHREMMHYPFLFAGFLALFFTALNLLPVGQLDGGHVIYGLFGKKRHGQIARVIFIIFVFYAGLGLEGFWLEYVHPRNAPSDLLLAAPLYVYFLFMCFRRMFPSAQTVLMFSLLVYVGQFITAYIFPDVIGYSGWLVFAFLVGRIIGVYHPGALVEQKLDRKRRILGWIALIVFIISFSPSPLVFT